jgi:hypothetical protein
MRTALALTLLSFSTPAWADCVYTGAKRSYLECIYTTALDAAAGLLGLQSDDAAQDTRLDGVDGLLAGLQTELDGVAASLASLTTDHETRLSAVEAALPSDTEIEGLARGVCFDTELELRGALDDDYRAASWVPSWNDLTDVPADIADGDGGQTYTAGDGITLTGTEIGLDTEAVEVIAGGVVDGDNTLVRSTVGGTGMMLRVGTLNRNNNVIEYTASNGTLHTLDFSGITTTQTRINAAQTIAMVRATGVATKLYLDISGSPGACTLWPYENDQLRNTLQVATDGGNGDGLIWPSGGKWTLSLSRPGDTNYVIESAETYAVVCFAY